MALSLLLASPLLAQAQGFQLFPGEAAGSSDFRTYIKNFYFFSIGAGILIATVLIMVGGIMWTTSAGNPGRIDKAKSYIIDSIIGVVLLLGSYTILQVINPNLVNLRLPTFPPFNVTLGACTYSTTIQSGKSGQKCLDTLQSQCNEIPQARFTSDTTCSEVCKVTDQDGFCVISLTEKLERAEEQGRDPQEILCNVQGNDGKGAVLPNDGINLANCRNYCKNAGEHCYASSWDDIDDDNMLCRCVYSPSGPP